MQISFVERLAPVQPERAVADVQTTYRNQDRAETSGVPMLGITSNCHRLNAALSASASRPAHRTNSDEKIVAPRAPARPTRASTLGSATAPSRPFSALNKSRSTGLHVAALHSIKGLPLCQVQHSEDWCSGPAWNLLVGENHSRLTLVEEYR